MSSPVSSWYVYPGIDSQFSIAKFAKIRRVPRSSGFLLLIIVAQVQIVLAVGKRAACRYTTACQDMWLAHPHDIAQEPRLLRCYPCRVTKSRNAAVDALAPYSGTEEATR